MSEGVSSEDRGRCGGWKALHQVVDKVKGRHAGDVPAQLAQEQHFPYLKIQNKENQVRPSVLKGTLCGYYYKAAAMPN